MAKIEKRGGPLDATTPWHLASRVLKEEKKSLIKCMGMWMKWDGRYRELDNDEILRIIWKKLDGLEHTLKGEVKRLVMKKSLRADVQEAMVAQALEPGVDRLPHWIGGKAPKGYPEDPSSLLPVNNGLLDWKTGRRYDPTRAFLTLASSPVEHDDFAEAPEWERFVHDIFDGDREQVDLLHEMLGCIVFGHLDFQKIFLLIGPPRSGKGTIIRALTDILGGPVGVASPTITQLSREGFNLASTVGKRAIVVADARIKRYSSDLVERLLSISGGDIQTINRKHRDDFIGYLDGQFLLASNELPALDDGSGAIASRYCMVRTRKSYLGKEDHTLYQRLLKPELPGVLNLLMEGLNRAERKGLTVPSSVQDDGMDLLRSTSTVAAFAKECVIDDAGAVTPKDEVYQMYERYCSGFDITPHMPSTFWRKLGDTGRYDSQSMEFKPNKKPRSVRGLMVNDDFIEYPQEPDVI